MANKPAFSIAEQIQLMKSRGMLFKNEEEASFLLKNISYYRLKGYWWDMQSDKTTHKLKPDSYFEDVFDRYLFDRHLRLILFDAIERIEVALRTKLIYHLSLIHGGLWYLNPDLFSDKEKHSKHIAELNTEFQCSQEIFIKDQRERYPDCEVDAWKIFEVASMGSLSKFYKNLDHQLPGKASIAKEMGLNLHSELSSWLEAIGYVRNIVAHHSRLWSRNMVKTPRFNLVNPSGLWFTKTLEPVQTKKPFLIISCMVYLCDAVSPNHNIRKKLLSLFDKNPQIPIYKLGFLNSWEKEPLWK